MPKKREIKEYSTDPAAQEMLTRAEEMGIGTAFTRADSMAPCNIGGAGMWNPELPPYGRRLP